MIKQLLGKRTNSSLHSAKPSFCVLKSLGEEGNMVGEGLDKKECEEDGIQAGN